MKKILSIICAVVCSFSLAACSDSAKQSLEGDVQSQLSSIAESAALNIAGMDDAQIDKLIEEYSDEDDKAVDLKALESWKLSKDELGSMDELSDIECEYDEDNKQYVVEAKGNFSGHDGSIRMTADKKYNMTSLTFDVDYTFGEKLQRAGMNTVMGVCIVVCMLLLISLVISCFGFIHSYEEKAKAAAEAKKKAAEPVQPAAEIPAEEPEEEELADDTELVAVIAAAIAAYEGTSPEGLVVRSIKRAKTSNWKRA